jgi:hypothetical protein
MVRPMKALRSLVLALALIPGLAAAQTFPTVPDHTVIGRLGSGTGSGPSQAMPFSALAAQLYPIGTTRVRLLANTIFYVDDINGNDANLCLAATTGACKTLNGAIAAVGSYDLNFHNITVNVAAPASSYAGVACLQPWVGATEVTFVGNVGNPMLVPIAGGSASAVDVENNCSVNFQGFSVSTTSGPANVQAVLGGRTKMAAMDFGASASDAPVVYSSRVASYIELNDSLGAHTFHTGSAPSWLFQVSHSGEIRASCTSACLKLTGNLTFSQSVLYSDGGEIIFTPSATFNLNGFTATGSKSLQTVASTIQINGNSPPLETDIPGTFGSCLIQRDTAVTGPTIYSAGCGGSTTSFILLVGGNNGVFFQKHDNSANTLVVDDFGNATLLGTVATAGYTIGGLPTCNSAAIGRRAYVSNGVTSPSFLGTVSTTGAVVAPVFCNGTSWVYG